MHRHHAGFNLIELLLTTMIVAVLLTLALPNMSALLERSRVTSTHNQLAAAFAHARLLALTQRSQAVVCPSSDGASCRTDGVWDSGWITFVDVDSNGSRDTTEPLLKAEVPIADGLRIRSSTHRSGALFRANGMARGANLTLRMCNSSGKTLAALVLNNGGRVRVARHDEVRSLSPC